MGPERAFLKDILVSACKIQQLIEGSSLETLSRDDTAQAALLYHLVIIGEAVQNLPGPLLDRYPQVPWHAVVALRNRVIHGYFGVDWNLIWQTVSEHVPAPKEIVARILQDEFQERPPGNP